MQTLNTGKVCQVRVNSRKFSFIWISRNNTKVLVPNKREMGSLFLSRSELCMVSRCHGILRGYCYCFYLEPTVRKDTLDEKDFRQCYGNCFSKVAFWNLVDHSYVQFLSQQLRDTLKTTLFETNATVEFFTDM